MSKKQSLSKALLLSLFLAMPYQSVVLGADFNSEQVIGSGGLVADDKATDYGSNATANHRVEADISGAIDVKVTAGDGYSPMYGTSATTAGGVASNTLTIAEDSVIGDTITLQAVGGRGGTNCIGGTANSELVLTADKLIEVKDILISSIAGEGGQSVYKNAGSTVVDTAAAGGLATAIGIKSSAAQVALNAQDLTVNASGGKGGKRYQNSDSGGDIGGTGGAASAYGLHTSGSSGYITLQDVVITASGGAAGISDNANKMSGVAGGNGGLAEAYGWSGESSELSITMDSIKVSALAGAAGDGTTGGSNLVSSNGGDGGIGGAANAYGFYAKSDNQMSISVQDITVTAQASNAGRAGSAGSNGIGNGGNGANGGAAQAYGLYAADNNQISGTLGNIVVKATAGSGSDGGYSRSDGLRQGDGGAGGDGGAATATGIYTHNATLDLEAKEVIITAIGGNSGNNAYSSYGLIGLDGIGGAAEAYGLHLLSSSGIANLVRIESIATGGNNSPRPQGSGYGEGGAAAAYGLALADSSQLSVNIADDILVTATGGFGNHSQASKTVATKATDGGAATTHGILVGNNSILTLNMGDLTATAQSGKGGNGSIIYDYLSTAAYQSGSDASSSGQAESYGLYVEQGSQLTATMQDINIASSGGGTGTSGDYEHKSSASGGNSKAYALVADSSMLKATFNQATVTATAGKGAAGTQINWWNGSFKGGAAGDGADAQAAAVYGSDSELSITAKDLIITATGGTGGTGGSSYNDGGDAGSGGAALAYGLDMIGGTAVVEVSKIESMAVGGIGGVGGDGGRSGNSGNGGNGGIGGAATAYGISATDTVRLVATLDSIEADAQAGAAGAAGVGNGVGKVDGAAGAQGHAVAYGVYATSGADIELYAANAAIDIGASASGDSTSKAYAVYAADNARVFFGSDVNLNKDKNLQIDNSAVTYLDTATLGFADSKAKDQSVGRTLSGGVLELHGSNTLRFATDLTNNTADRMSFDSLAANSTDAAQYITVAYDKSFDGSNDNSIEGKGTVLSFANLNGNSLSKFIGQESKFDSPLNEFLATPTVEVSGNDVNITRIDFKTIGASESVMMAADADMAMRGIWRVESNNLMKRMGELRNDSTAGKGGVWARYYGGQLNGDGGYGRNFDQNYNAFQAGIDRVQDYKEGKLVTGFMVNHIKGSSGYYAGSGDVSSTGVGIYGSWLSPKGHYIDVVARMSKLSNNFKLVDKSDNFASADYSKWAYGISAEYGYRKNLSNGWFVEPQVELMLGHINSGEYTMSNGLQVQQDAINTFTGRLGVLTGKSFTNKGGVGNTYIKASVLHEFSGNGSAQAYYQGNGLNIQTGDMSGTWCELGVGANVPLSNKSNLYFDAIKTFGSKMKSNWQVNIGLRFGF